MNTSINDYLYETDAAAKAAMYTGLGNWALGQLLWQTQQYVRALRSDNTQDQRTPPYGLEPMETAQAKQQRFGALYAIAVHECTKIGADQYNSPQTIADRVKWLSSQSGAAVAKARDLKARGDVTRALRVASEANAQAAFWAENAEAITQEATFHAQDLNETAYNIDELLLTPVEKYNAVTAMYKGLLSKINNQKSSRFFEASGQLGDMIRSDVGVCELELKTLRELSAAVESQYSKELYAAINNGITLAVIEDVEKAANAKLNARLEAELAKLGL
ncbi:MAG: hypothetical protein DDT39_00010 [Firmicutes bacterium]|nr:hypothetical protein [candidate division NPL-UPA2 bacterium]